MGTINYRTSDYITIGLEPINAYDLEQDADFMDEIRAQIAEYGGTAEDAIADYIMATEEEDRYMTEVELNRHSFEYFTVTIEPGYYEGFSLDIYSMFPDDPDVSEQREIMQEIAELKQLLYTLINNGLCSVWPGWCTTYRTRAESLEDIDAAIETMYAEIDTYPEEVTA